MTTDQTVGLWGRNIWRTFSGCALFANARVSIFSRRGCGLQVKNVVTRWCTLPSCRRRVADCH